MFLLSFDIWYFWYLIWNIFSQSVAYLFILLTLSFKELKYKILIKSSLSYFSFMDHLLILYLRTICLTLHHKDCFPVFSSRSLVFLDFTLRSVMHFELIFVYVVRNGLRFIFCIWMFSCFLAPIVVMTVLSLSNCLFIFVMLFWQIIYREKGISCPTTQYLL